MPEVISKHPEITLRVLQGAGARCGEGAPQAILTQCPRERFCATPVGEICVYGLNEIPQMTQISPAEIIEAVGGAVPEAGLPDPVPLSGAAAFGPAMFFAIIVALMIGLVVGRLLSRRTPEK